MKLKTAILTIIAAAVLAVSLPPVVVEQAEARVLGNIIGKAIGRAGGRSHARSGSGSERILSKQELRSCVNRDTDIESETVKLEAQSPEPPSRQNIDSLQLEIDKSAREIDELNTRIRIADPLVDLRSESSVNAFNAMLRKAELEIDKHNALVARQGKLVVAYNSDADAYDSAVAQYKLVETEIRDKANRFNSECGGHSYYVDDMNAILAEKQACAEGHSCK